MKVVVARASDLKRTAVRNCTVHFHFDDLCSVISREMKGNVTSESYYPECFPLLEPRGVLGCTTSASVNGTVHGKYCSLGKSKRSVGWNLLGPRAECMFRIGFHNAPLRHGGFNFDC